MDTYGRVTALLVCVQAYGEKAKRSFLPSIPLFLLYCFVFPPVIINGHKMGGECVLEILRNFICRSGNPDGIGIYLIYGLRNILKAYICIHALLFICLGHGSSFSPLGSCTAVAVSLGCCAKWNQAAEPQIYLLSDPLHCSCGTADSEARYCSLLCVLKSWGESLCLE